MLLRRLCIVGSLATATAAAAAEDAAKPIPGYVCMALNLTEAQVLDPNIAVPIYSEEKQPDGKIVFKKAINSGSVVFVRQPTHVVQGYVEVLRFDNGKPGWIARDMVKPMRGHCTPARRADGRLEIDP